MKVMFVGSNPSQAQEDPSVPFAGSRSNKVLTRWIDEVAKGHFVVVANVSGKVTPDNRPLRVSEFNLPAITTLIAQVCPDAVVALGKTASQALSKIPVKHFTLPHPSGRNRLLNSKEYEAECLKKCKDFLQERVR